MRIGISSTKHHACQFRSKDNAISLFMTKSINKISRFNNSKSIYIKTEKMSQHMCTNFKNMHQN